MGKAQAAGLEAWAATGPAREAAWPYVAPAVDAYNEHAKEHVDRAAAAGRDAFEKARPHAEAAAQTAYAHAERGYGLAMEHGVPLAKQAYSQTLELCGDAAERLEPLRLQAEAQVLEVLQKIDHPQVAPHANAETARLIVQTLVLGPLVLLAFHLVGRLFRRKRKPPASSPGRPSFKPQAPAGGGKGKGKAGKRRA